jgi:hypothetical protein
MPAPICTIISEWQTGREKLPEPTHKVLNNNRTKQG